MKKLTFVLLVIGLIALPAAAQAVQVRGVFTGHFDSVSVSPLAPEDFLSEVGTGTRFMGSFTYDTSYPIIPIDFSPYPIVSYDANDFTSHYTIFGNTQKYQLTGSHASSIWVVNDDASVDSIVVIWIGIWNGSIAGWVPDEGAWDLRDSTGTAFEDNSLPTRLHLHDFDSNYIWFCNANDGTEIWGTLDSLTVHPVPEPATMLLLASGLVGLAGLRRKFRK